MVMAAPLFSPYKTLRRAKKNFEGIYHRLCAIGIDNLFLVHLSGHSCLKAFKQNTIKPPVKYSTLRAFDDKRVA